MSHTGNNDKAERDFEIAQDYTYENLLKRFDEWWNERNAIVKPKKGNR